MHVFADLSIDLFVVLTWICFFSCFCSSLSLSLSLSLSCLIWVVFLLVLGAYTLHTCLRERLRNASATARGAYARTFVSCRAYADAYARKSRAAFFQLELCNAKSIVVRHRCR